MSVTYDKIDPVMAARLSRSTLAKAVLLLAVFAFAYSTPVALLLREWASPDFSHGILVPFASLYFLWIERGRLKGVPVRPDYAAGAAFMAAAALVLILGKAGRAQVAEEASILLVIPGLVSLLLGRGYLRVLKFPLAYLAFMVPLINPFLDRIYWPFQIFAAKSTAVLLPYFGVPVYRRMQFLELPNISLEVATGCSGLKFMISVYAVAVPLAYFTQRGWARKAVLLVSAFIIGLLTNVVRVTLIGVWTYFKLGDTLHGPYHLLQGYFVSIAGFILLFLTSMALNKFRFNRFPEVKKDESAPVAVGRPMAITNAPLVIAVVFLAGIGWYMHFFAVSPVPPTQPLDRLPLSIGEWRGEAMNNAQSPVRAPGAGSELTRLYRKADGSEAILYIGYIDAQRDGGELVNDYFNDYFNGITEVSVPDIRGGMPVNKKIMKAGGKEYLAIFWYDLDGSIFTGTKAMKLRSAWDGLVRGRTNGAVVMIISELKGAEDADNVFREGASLAQGVRPLLKGLF